jgi:hypothetical protein
MEDAVKSVCCVEFDAIVAWDETHTLEQSTLAPLFLEWLAKRSGIVILVTQLASAPGGVDQMALWLVDQVKAARLAGDFAGGLQCEVQFDNMPRAGIPWFSKEAVRQRHDWLVSP